MIFFDFLAEWLLTISDSERNSIKPVSKCHRDAYDFTKFERLAIIEKQNKKNLCYGFMSIFE